MDQDDTVLRQSTPRDDTDDQANASNTVGWFSVLVLSDRHIATYPLPATGDIVIGRSADADILIDDASISRKHAILTIGGTLEIRDEGSINGTWISGRRLVPGHTCEITASQPVLLGSVTLIVQRRSVPLRPRRLWTHDYFEVRLEEECARARRTAGAFALLRVRCANATQGQDALMELVRLSDVVGEYGPGEYELLLVGATSEQAEAAQRRFLDEFSRRGFPAEVGVACFSRDGVAPDELMACAGRFGRPKRRDEELGAGKAIIADRAMQELYRLASRVASGNIGVLILGETGAGKEVLAEHVHRSSPRAAKPYVKLNCAALSESLLESELFGHERGAFTGAIKDKPGLLETADGGTVFLDELGELPIATQVKLLRVIEERIVLRVGGVKPRQIDVRFIAATNRDLDAEIARGNFRQDLYYRLNGATLVIPPLRDRAQEILPLAERFLEQAAQQAGLARAPLLTPQAIETLERYAWPGNIRELRNVIERAVLLSGGDPITPNHLPVEKMRSTFTASARPTPTPADADHAQVRSVIDRVDLDDSKLTVEERDEKARIVAALQECVGNQTRAAERLGIGRRALVYKLDRYGIARPRKRD